MERHLQLSVVIPTLNEARYLARTIEVLKSHTRDTKPEILVVDCGSEDRTIEVARKAGVAVLERTPPYRTRAEALNAGGRAATGEILLFLDADTQVPEGYDRLVAQALGQPGVRGGAFEFAFAGKGFGLRLVEVINRIRYRIRPRYYGDQGVFVDARVFAEVDGYPPRSVMETPAFCDAVRKHGRLVLLPQRIETSPRRFEEGGVYRVLAGDIRIWWRDLLGLPVERLAEVYRQDNRRRGRAGPAEERP